MSGMKPLKITVFKLANKENKMERLDASRASA
jgi:hypothetical protein